MTADCTIIQGDALTVLKTLPSESVHCVVTSPPYWGLRDYGVEGQLGLERTPEEYVAKMVEVFREVRRVLREDGTLWMNMGDAYAQAGGQLRRENETREAAVERQAKRGTSTGQHGGWESRASRAANTSVSGLKPKDLCGIPWRLAFALQSDGWWLRQDIIWHKPNPMPESVTDRCTKAHEYVFLLTKAERYFFDAEAIKEPADSEPHAPNWANSMLDRNDRQVDNEANHRVWAVSGTRNRRSVWTIPSEPYPESHFATFPTALVKPCILAGTSALGCCPKCGAPWERVVEQVPPPKCHRDPPRPKVPGNDQMAAGVRANADNWNGPELAAWKLKNPPKESWNPTCHCGLTDTVPCFCLDPFGGSGTVGQVALELGRRAILIELNPLYVELARKRTNVTPGLQLA